MWICQVQPLMSCKAEICTSWLGGYHPGQPVDAPCLDDVIQSVKVYSGIIWSELYIMYGMRLYFGRMNYTPKMDKGIQI